jgi:hypothetical protein
MKDKEKFLKVVDQIPNLSRLADPTKQALIKYFTKDFYIS